MKAQRRELLDDIVVDLRTGIGPTDNEALGHKLRPSDDLIESERMIAGERNEDWLGPKWLDDALRRRRGADDEGDVHLERAHLADVVARRVVSHGVV